MVRLLFSRSCGEWLDFQPLRMLGRLGNELVVPEERELMPMPEGATLTLVPGRHCIGMDEEGKIVSLSRNPYNTEEDEEIFAVAALLPQGFTRTLLPAITDHGDTLPILGYTAVGVADDGTLMVAAMQTDEDDRWNPKRYNTEDLETLVEKRKAEFPGNKLICQLAKCSLEYGCFTAQNIMYRRFEGGLPVSPVCNARCIGCLSLQECDDCESPQQRIKTSPKAEDVAEVAAAHLKTAQYPIVSFGQGCEGEPCLQGDLISDIIGQVRRETRRGTINMNTNAGSYENMQKIIDAGIDSLRVSMISAVDENYAKYHRPVNYTFADVKKSIAYAKKHGVKVAVNYLAYPGFNDRLSELEAMVDLCQNYGIDQIQIRNLNIDPKIMTELYGEAEQGLGVPVMLDILWENLPDTVIGNYSYPVEE
ncbi:MAG: radical SAM protein [Bacillota bacterium]|jgi:pyruvate-formate lyase-activating enzyme